MDRKLLLTLIDNEYLHARQAERQFEPLSKAAVTAGTPCFAAKRRAAHAPTEIGVDTC